MRTLAKVRAYGRAFARLRGRKPPADLARLLVKRPLIGLGVGAFETVSLLSSRAPTKPKALAQIKTGALVGCPF